MYATMLQSLQQFSAVTSVLLTFILVSTLSPGQARGGEIESLVLTGGQSQNVNRGGILQAFRKGNGSSEPSAFQGFGGLNDREVKTPSHLNIPSAPPTTSESDLREVSASRSTNLSRTDDEARMNKTQEETSPPPRQQTSFTAEKFLQFQRCHVRQREVLLKVDGCRNKRVNTSTCRGRCASWVLPQYAVVSPEHSHESSTPSPPIERSSRSLLKPTCNCCKPVEYSSTKQVVSLQCEEGERLLPIATIASCACSPCGSSE